MKVPPSNPWFLFLAAWALQLLAPPSTGQTFEVLQSWSDIGSTPNEGVVRGSDGNFYGTIPSGTKREPTSGIFRLEPSGRVTILRTFSIWRSLDGYQTNAGLVVGPDGAFYGINSMGGANNAGTAFRITENGEYTKVADFNNSVGANPEVTLTDGRDGFLYGVTKSDDKGHRGSIFRLSPSGGVKPVLQFPDGIPSKAASAIRLTLGPDGALYGIGAGKDSIIRVTTDGRLTNLHTFDRSEGSSLSAGLIRGTDGNLYGVASFGGLYQRWHVFPDNAGRLRHGPAFV